MAFLNPTSIAVIGASAQEGKVGHDVLKNLLTQGYKGKVFPVNPKGAEILGKKAYISVSEISEVIDLAIIVTPASTVANVLRECAAKNIHSAIIISAGFKEAGTGEGKTREKEIREIAREHTIELLGPNCLGMLRPSIGLNASFAKELPPAGSIALISQSGAFLVALLDASEHLHLGFSTVLSIGNKTALDECDFLEMCAEDPQTRVIGLYLESIENGERFRDVAARVAQQKRIVLIKGGVSTFGKRAAASHTGALAGSDGAIDAVCAQTGIHRAHTLGEFTDLLQVLSTQPPLLSPRIAIITNAGGPGILAADAAEREGLLLPALSDERDQLLRTKLPATASTKNPIDVIGDAGADRFEAALEACISDSNIDGVAVLLTPQVMTPVQEIAEAIVRAETKNGLMPIVTSFLGGASVQAARDHLAAHTIPSFETPEQAMHALAALRQKRTNANVSSFARTLSPRKNEQTKKRVSSAHALLKNKHDLLNEDDTISLLKLYNLPTPHQILARSKEEAILGAQAIGYPVVAKISSPQIIHKTDVGGIWADIETEQELTQAFETIMKNVGEKAPDAHVRGILIQKFLPVGSELIIGGMRDPSFGPLVMAGLGGIYTELFRDISFRLSPMTKEEGYAMLQELKSWKMLLGLRGKKTANIALIVQIILGVSALMRECPQIQELDFNPVLIHDEDVTVADAKIITKDSKDT